MGTSLILGFFDGVHLGHQAVIKSAIDAAPKNKVILLTFVDSPAKFFCGHADYILSRQNSVIKLKHFGINEVVLQNFEEIYSQSAEEYLNHIINKYEPELIATGFNYSFGANKTGTPKLLESYSNSFKYICTPPIKYDKEIISSTTIKKYLQSGNIIQANKLLGSNFILEGTVVKGQQLGREMGFPTANFSYPEEIVNIPYGAYAVKALNHIGIMNFGIKPTIEGTHTPVAEVHLLDYTGDLYGKNITVEVLKKLRNEKKFANIEELKTQIQKDKEACLKLSL